MVSGEGEGTYKDQIANLVHVELGEEGTVEPGEQDSRRDGVLEMTSRHSQPLQRSTAQKRVTYTSA